MNCFAFLLLHVATTLSDPILLQLLLSMLYQILVYEICQIFLGGSSAT
jgi:hypothetical protein